MIKYKIGDSLLGKVILSYPMSTDSRFVKSVLLIVSHKAENTMGFVLNKKSAHQFSHIVKSVDSEFDLSKADTKGANIKISLGGPVSPNNLFILHSNDYKDDSTVKISKDVSMTNQQSIIKDLANGKGPKNSVISIGAAVWQPEQIEKELVSSNSWLITDFNPSDLFNMPQDTMYDDIAKTIGLNTEEHMLLLNNEQI